MYWCGMYVCVCEHIHTCIHMHIVIHSQIDNLLSPFSFTHIVCVFGADLLGLASI